MNISALQATGKQRGLGLEPQEEILADFSTDGCGHNSLDQQPNTTKCF